MEANPAMIHGKADAYDACCGQLLDRTKESMTTNPTTHIEEVQPKTARVYSRLIKFVDLPTPVKCSKDL